MAESFNAVKNVYYKNNGQLVQHIIIGFGEKENIVESEATFMATVIAGYFYDKGYQRFWGVHWGSKGCDFNGGIIEKSAWSIYTDFRE